MSNLVYLFLAIALSVVGTLILLYRQRKPSSMESTIEEFNRELRALSPDRREQGEERPG